MSPARTRTSALARVALAAAIVLALHTVGHVSAWWLVLVGAAAALLLWAGSFAGGPAPRLARDDRLALWIVLVVLTIIGYLHNANEWGPDGRGLLRPTQVGLWKTELVLGVALAVPLLGVLGRLWRPGMPSLAGQRFAREFALYVNFSGIALALWDGDALLSREVAATLLAWVALAELTLYASE